MPDPFVNFSDSVMAASRKPYVVVPSDINPLDPLPKALMATAAGNVVLRGADNAADLAAFPVVAGQIVPIRALFVRATGTTASFVALA